MFGLGGGELIAILMIFLLCLLPIIFTIWSLIDLLKNEFTGSNKLIWTLIVIFLAPLGCILYFFIGTKQKINNDLVSLH
jgi:hypothetical protein